MFCSTSSTPIGRLRTSSTTKAPISCTIEGCTPSEGSSSSSSSGRSPAPGRSPASPAAARECRRAGAHARAGTGSARRPPPARTSRTGIDELAHAQIVEHGHVREDLAPLRHIAHAAPRRLSAASPVTSSPLKLMPPRRGRSRPMMPRISVLLPTPLRPSTPTILAGPDLDAHTLQHVARGVTGGQILTSSSAAIRPAPDRCCARPGAP